MQASGCRSDASTTLTIPGMLIASPMSMALIVAGAFSARTSQQSGGVPSSFAMRNWRQALQCAKMMVMMVRWRMVTYAARSLSRERTCER